MEEFKNKYDEALERAREVYNRGYYIMGDLETIFPELAESEDERIRKALIELVKFSKKSCFEILKDQSFNIVSMDAMLAWLEKQGTKELDPRHENLEELLVADNIYQMSMNDAMVEEAKSKAINALSELAISKLLDLEKQGEKVTMATMDKQKPAWSEEEQNRFAKGVLSNCALSFIKYLDAHKYEGKMCVSNGECEDIENAFHNAMWDRLHRYYCKYIEKQDENYINKVEPKFNIGEWIVWQDKCYKINYNGCGYELVDQNGLSTSLEYGTIDENAHLWDITKDAKPGDVLYCESCGIEYIIILKHINNYKTLDSYCRYNSIDGFAIDVPTVMAIEDNPNPATKEQCDTLFAKMREAGYEWDAEKKELINHNKTAAR